MQPIRCRTAADLPAVADLLTITYAVDGYPVEGPSAAATSLTTDPAHQAWVVDAPVPRAKETCADSGAATAALWGHVQVFAPQDRVGDCGFCVTTWTQAGGVPPAVLARLAVHPASRGHGVGTALVHRVMEYAAERQWPLVLDVLDKDDTAIRLYRRLGWSDLGPFSFHANDTDWTGVALAAPGANS